MQTNNGGCIWVEERSCECVAGRGMSSKAGGESSGAVSTTGLSLDSSTWELWETEYELLRTGPTAFLSVAWGDGHRCNQSIYVTRANCHLYRKARCCELFFGERSLSYSIWVLGWEMTPAPLKQHLHQKIITRNKNKTCQCVLSCSMWLDFHRNFSLNLYVTRAKERG